MTAPRPGGMIYGMEPPGNRAKGGFYDLLVLSRNRDEAALAGERVTSNPLEHFTQSDSCWIGRFHCSFLKGKIDGNEDVSGRGKRCPRSVGAA